MIDAFIKHINILMNDGGKFRNFSEIKISQVCIIVPDRAFIFGVTTRNQPDKRRFSTAASAHKRIFLSLFYVQRESVYHIPAAVIRKFQMINRYFLV